MLNDFLHYFVGHTIRQRRPANITPLRQSRYNLTVAILPLNFFNYIRKPCKHRVVFGRRHIVLSGVRTFGLQWPATEQNGTRENPFRRNDHLSRVLRVHDLSYVLRSLCGYLLFETYRVVFFLLLFPILQYENTVLRCRSSILSTK